MAVAAILAVSCNKDDKAKKSKTDPGDGGEPQVTLSAELYVKCPDAVEDPRIWAWCKDGDLNNGQAWPNGLAAESEKVDGYYLFKLGESYINKEETGFLVVGKVGEETKQTVDYKGPEGSGWSINNGDKLYFEVGETPNEEGKFPLEKVEK